MIRTTAELLNTYGSHYAISKAVAAGELSKVGHGLYSDEAPELSELETICTTYPNAVLTAESAFAYHGLSDYVPDHYSFATPLNAHRMRNEKVVQSFMTVDIVRVGVMEVQSERGVIRVYGKERMLIELFRLKSKFPPNYFREVVNSYRVLVKEEGINFRALTAYCRRFKKGALIKARIEEVVL